MVCIIVSFDIFIIIDLATKWPKSLLSLTWPSSCFLTLAVKVFISIALVVKVFIIRDLAVKVFAKIDLARQGLTIKDLVLNVFIILDNWLSRSLLA